MKQVGKNRIKIQRGEAILLSIDLTDDEGNEYTLPSDIENPYVLVTICNSKYNLGEWYNMNFWIDYNTVSDNTATLRLDNIFTRDLMQGQYILTVKIVGGKTTYQILKSIYESMKVRKLITEVHDPEDNKSLYDAIKFLDADMVKGIDWTEPLGQLTTCDVINSGLTLLVD